MSTITKVNIVLGVIAATLVGILVWMETSEDPPPPTTTTTTTTTVPPTTTTTTSTTTTTTTTTTTSTTTTTTPPPPSTEVPIERFFVPIVVANGTTQGELLAPAVSRLNEAGYGFVRGLNSQARKTDTVIYARTEEELGEAEIVALDLGFDLDETEILLFDEAPTVSGLLDALVIVFLGSNGLPDPPEVDDSAEG